MRKGITITMYWNVSATKKESNELCFVKDVSGEKELENAVEMIQNIATDLQENLLITITPRVHLMTVKPKEA